MAKKLPPEKKRQVALTLAKRAKGVTAAEFAAELKEKTVGPMAKMLNTLAKAGVIHEEGERNGKRYFRAANSAKLPPELSGVGAKKKGKRGRKPKAKAAAPKKAAPKRSATSARATEKPQDTALRLAKKAGGFTLDDLARERDSAQVGPFKRTVNKLMKEGLLRVLGQKDGRDVYTAKGSAPAPAAPKKRGRKPKAKAAAAAPAPKAAKAKTKPAAPAKAKAPKAKAKPAAAGLGNNAAVADMLIAIAKVVRG